MKTRALAVLVLAVAALSTAACNSAPKSSEIEANQKSLASTLGHDIATYYVDYSEELTLTRTGNTITLAEVSSKAPISAYELSGPATDFNLSDIYYRDASLDTSWCLDIGYGEGPVFGYEAGAGLIDVPCADA